MQLYLRLLTHLGEGLPRRPSCPPLPWTPRRRCGSGTCRSVGRRRGRRPRAGPRCPRTSAQGSAPQAPPPHTSWDCCITLKRSNGHSSKESTRLDGSLFWTRDFTSFSFSRNPWAFVFSVFYRLITWVKLVFFFIIFHNCFRNCWQKIDNLC